MEGLIKSIQSINDGKTIHTRNKAIFYLRKWKDDGEKRKQGFEALIKACRRAVKKNNWDIVKCILWRCW